MSGLYDADKGGREHTLEKTEKSDRLVIGRGRIRPKTFNKMVATVDTALLNLTPSVASQLTWTMCGALIGYNSSEPTRNTNHIWDKSFEAFRGNVKNSNIFVGCLVRWRIAALANTTGDIWITMKQDTGGTDIDSGEPITRACYWINNNFIPPQKMTGHSLGALAAKFNSKYATI